MKAALLIALVSVVCAGVTVSLFRTYRSAAQEPQGQIAESVVKLLALDVAPSEIVVGVDKTDIRTSAAPWVVIYDAHTAPLASSALLDNAVPHIPEGVFTYAKSAGENRVTWQPDQGVRHSIVVMPAGDEYFVVSGRSLSETETELGRLYKQLAIVWALGCIFVGFWYTAVVRGSRRRRA